MAAPDYDWPWQPGDFAPRAGRAADDASLLAARVFRGADGERFLAYLRSLTLDRALGPAAADQALRHLEGQRQLVQHIANLVAQGRGGAGAAAPIPQQTEGDKT